MADLKIKTRHVVQNIKKINDHLEKHGIKWSLITKILCGHKGALEKVMESEEIQRVHSIGDSRLSSLKVIKQINPKIRTMYIKPPAIQHAKSVVQFADISLNTSFSTIESLNKEALEQDKIHEIIIMIELGELREGIMRDNLVEFYKSVFELSNIKIAGIGTNLGCMYGVEPTYDKLIQLSLYKQLLEQMFSRKMELVSGGSSITLPLVSQKKIPVAVNHFRIGEAAFLGTSPYDNKKFRNLSMDCFEYESNILELEEKEYVPDGIISEASIGHISEEDLNGREDGTSYKAILDFGILDVDVNEIEANDTDVNFIGTTSDLTVYDLGKNLTKSGRKKYKVGDKIIFTPNYMGVARLMNSKFIEKKVV
ncbi:MAG: alanine racemase [Candidatus Kapaibacterium sp.]